MPASHSFPGKPSSDCFRASRRPSSERIVRLSRASGTFPREDQGFADLAQIRQGALRGQNCTDRPADRREAMSVMMRVDECRRCSDEINKPLILCCQLQRRDLARIDAAEQETAKKRPQRQESSIRSDKARHPICRQEGSIKRQADVPAQGKKRSGVSPIADELIRGAEN